MRKRLVSRQQRVCTCPESEMENHAVLGNSPTAIRPVEYLGWIARPDRDNQHPLDGNYIMTNAIAYSTLLAVGLASYFGLPWFVLLFGAAVLTAIAVLEQWEYRPRLAAMGMTDLLQTTAMASLGSGLLAAVAAYVVGLVVRSAFGG